ncbi:MAG: sulfatase-like hydrolase/transferase [Succinivibrionaceae bacterium]|nr:sulfatase-like hydrolase/transferase [Succinivibrionaceae bacterium]
MSRIRYGYAADLICCLLISLVLGATLCSFSKGLILKEIPGGNVVELEYEYLKERGQLRVTDYDEDLQPVNSDNIAVDEARRKQTYLTDIPFIHSHRIAFSFGADDNLVAVSKLVVNGERIDLRDISHVFKISSDMGALYSEDYHALIIHSRSADNELEFAPGFNRIIHLTRQELSDLKRTEIVVNIVYLLFCCLAAFVAMYIFMHACMKRHIMFLFYGCVFFVTLLSFDMSFVKVTENYLANLNNHDFFGNMLKLQQSYLPLLFIGLLLPLVGSCQIGSHLLRTVVLLVPACLIAVLLLDSFVFCNIDSRFMFMQIERSDFFQHYRYVLPFIVKYVKSPAGMFMNAGIALFLVCCVISFRRLAMKDRITMVVASVIGIVLVGFGMYPIKYEYNDHKFSNVFQINNFTTNKLGNYQKDYLSIYPPRDGLDFAREIRKGDNRRRNVIVLLVSSLDCSVTFVCGLDDNFMPNLERIASENLVFDNYYSNNFNVYGSYLTVVKGIPYFPPRSSSGFSEYASKLYERDDMLDNFRKHGYTTSFFSGTDLLFGMDTVVADDNYDHVYTNRSEEFSGVKRRYIFNSVPDADLLDAVAEKAAGDREPYLYLVRTASSHSPYSTPWGDYNFEQAFRYTDSKIGLFVQKLQSQGFFENGTLIITGDHKAMDNPRVAEHHSGIMVQNKVPLVVIGGEHRAELNHTYFSHSSLGVMLQSAELPRYEVNRFQADPLHDPSPETIFHYEFERKNFVIVKVGDEEAEIKMLGNDTEFQRHTFSAEIEKDILGYLAWCRL